MNDCVKEFSFQKLHLCDGSFMKLGLWTKGFMSNIRLDMNLLIQRMFTEHADSFLNLLC